MVKKKPVYKLQRWWVGRAGATGKSTGRWETIRTSVDKTTILRAYNGWKRQIQGGSFRVRVGTRTVVSRTTSLYRKVKKRGKK